MKKLILLLGILVALLTFACSDSNDITPDESVEFWYRIQQVDNDGYINFYYNEEGKIKNKLNRKTNEFINVTCQTPNVEISIGVEYTWITINNGFHHDTLITADGKIFTPPTSDLGTAVQWQIPDSCLTTQFAWIKGHAKYTWEGEALNCTALPIELKSFNVTPKDGYNLLEIITLTETNASHMILERSEDFKDWRNLVIINLDNPNGSTYTYKDFYKE